MIYAKTHNAQYANEIQAFDTLANMREAEEEGWKLTRMSRREVEAEIGSSQLEIGKLDSEGCGYRVHAA